MFDAVSFALTLQSELMDLPLQPALDRAPCGKAASGTVALTANEKESRCLSVCVYLAALCIRVSRPIREGDRQPGYHGSVSANQAPHFFPFFLRLRAMRVGQFGRHAIADSDVLQLTAFKGLRFKMGVHVGSDAGGLQGPAVT